MCTYHSLNQNLCISIMVRYIYLTKLILLFPKLQLTITVPSLLYLIRQIHLEVYKVDCRGAVIRDSVEYRDDNKHIDASYELISRVQDRV